MALSAIQQQSRTVLKWPVAITPADPAVWPDRLLEEQRAARDWDDVTDEIEFEIVVQRDIPGVRRRNLKQGVAVWRRAHDGLDGEIAASAWLIHDDELLTEAFSQPLRDQPCTGVEWAARCIAHEQVHWPGWIRLSPGDATMPSGAKAPAAT